MNDITLIARSPAEMEAAQKGLKEWVGEKLMSVAAEMRDAMQNLQIAKDHKWKTVGWQNQVAKLRRQVAFYQKVKEAVTAGYYIVPPFPMTLIAVRTDAAFPPDQRVASQPAAIEAVEQPAAKLPTGEGTYVQPHSRAEWTSWGPRQMQPDGTYKRVEGYRTGDWKDFDFPFKLVKPQLLAQLAEAMQAKIFDQIGIMRPTVAKADPILLGQILSPTRGRPPTTFFIGWWLDTRDIA